jgi:hypothetical protein
LKRLFFDYADHILPAVLIGVEMMLNRVPINMRHIAILVCISLVYGAVNVMGSFLIGHPIYPPLDPTKPLTYILAVGIMLMICAWYYVYVKLFEFRDRKYLEIDEKRRRVHSVPGGPSGDSMLRGGGGEGLGVN